MPFFLVIRDDLKSQIKRKINVVQFQVKDKVDPAWFEPNTSQLKVSSSNNFTMASNTSMKLRRSLIMDSFLLYLTWIMRLNFVVSLQKHNGWSFFMNLMPWCMQRIALLHVLAAFQKLGLGLVSLQLL